ncbi:Ig-like domain-containing protein [Clostridium sp.]|uniref:Ig-like domain-containing protein n=1 Tax=Clostridium sp. TaxID=1506 RepID=UPI0039F51249
MKNKRIIGLVLVYFFILTLLPMGFLSKEVQAIEDYKKYDSSSTKIANKYNIEGKILKLKQYEDYTLALTGDSLYFIQDGKAKKYNLGKIDIFPSTNIERSGKYIYLTPYRTNSMYKLLTIDSEKFTGESNFVNEYISFNDTTNNKLQEVIIDSSKNKWFSVYNSAEGIYNLLKVENTEGVAEKSVRTLKVSKSFNYDDAFTDLKSDSNEGIWFKVTENDSKTKKYMLTRIYKDDTDKTYTFDDDIVNYVIGNDDSVWVIHKDKIVHVAESGKVLKEFKGTNLKDIEKDVKGNVWVLDGDKIEEIVYDEIKEKYTVSKDSKEFSIEDENNIAVRNTRGFTLISKGEMEDTIVGSYVSNSAVVLKDKISDVRIISDNYNYDEDYKNSDDVLLEVTLKNNKFNIENNTGSKFKSYISAVIYNDEVYFVCDDIVYKLKDNSIEEYVKLNNEEGYMNYTSSITFDDNGYLYAVGEEKLYVVDKDKKVEEIELSKLHSYDDVIYNKLIKDKNDDVYLITKALNGVKLNKLNGSQYRAINYRSQNGDEPINIFLNENDELEFVCGDNLSGYKVYRLDENLTPQEDLRFSGQGSSLTENYPEIRKLEETGDGKLILWIGYNMLYAKEKNSDKFIGLYDIEANDNITSMVSGNDGKVYIGTYESGVLSYGIGINDILPSDYTTKSLEGKDLVSKNKEWNIKFNMKLDENTITEDNITVVDSMGRTQSVKVSLGEDNSSVKLTPNQPYEDGESYYIIVKDNVKSSSGKKLPKALVAQFKVNEDKQDDLNVKFEILSPSNLDGRQKSFMDDIINKWKDDFKGEVGKVTVGKVNLSSDTGFTSFSAETVVEKDGNKVKETQDISLNCKKVNGVWSITK